MTVSATPGKRHLVIVESPTKASKIASYLGPGYIVESSRGHVRDLPQGAADVPAKYKGEKWARTGVDVDHDFEPLYVVSADKKATLRSLKEKLKDADELLLATDGDREGEAIAWHLLQELKPKVPAKRMVFHEITPQAIKDAVAHTRDLDTDLVDAQETRRILDRLYGYEVSPVLWKKVMPRLSAGRVQSVATRLIVDRERERMAFVPASYWDLVATLESDPAAIPRHFPARVVTLGAHKLAQGRDFSSRGKLKSGLLALDEPLAERVARGLRVAAYKVTSVEAKPYTRRPYAPFRTTTLQQEAGRKLGFSAQRTMSVAQDLYEGGWITYMRTDSVTLSTQAVEAARNQVRDLFGPEFLPAAPRVYTSKVKNAQEAHEAIRPAGEVFATPRASGLTGDQRKLYELIWMRTVASQMKDAEGQSVTAQISARWADPVTVKDQPVAEAGLVATGRTITFPGFLKAYVEGHDDPDAEDDDAQAKLPKLAAGMALTPAAVRAEGHETRPPARYTEPSLVAKLEELEIGRPSTYASIIRTITARDYVFKRGSALVPTWLAFTVTRLLEEQFPKLVDYKFTATMEEDLDEIAKGDARRLEVLNQFYFGSPATGEGLHQLVTALGDIDARKLSSFTLPGEDGLTVRVGKYGTYIEDAAGRRANVPDELPPDELTPDHAKSLLDAGGSSERLLGTAPDTGYAVVAKDGRYGPYVAEVLPEDAAKKTKARSGSLFKSMDLDTVTLDQALKLLNLPRVVGEDEDGQTITTQNGRFGPYIKKGTDSRPLASEEAIFSTTLAQAKAIFAVPKVRGRTPPTALRELGADPVSGGQVVVRAGRFGPYVTDGLHNATLRKGDAPETITLDRAAELLAEKRAKPPTAPRSGRARVTRAPAKTTARVVKAKKK
ncbi:MAG: type I DNA topoisomerase [Propionibacteriaceae bacterium]|jgi:DNA topoisomerase-1|nr:type I DNA topoisomerase [Propionibacteriaceae bacterium]